MDRPRTYLYAIVADEVEIDPGAIGVPDGTGPVTGVRAGGLTAVVSPYAGPPVERLSRADVLRVLIMHQGVIERITADHPVLPAKLGTVIDSPDVARQALTVFRPRLEHAFRDIAGAMEVDLSATWNLAEIFGEIRQELAVAALAGSAGEEVEGASLATRIEAGKLVHEALERRREAYRHRAVEVLGPLVRDMRRNPAPADELVLNLALLVDRTRLGEVDDSLDQLAAEWDGQVSFRYVGPLPPYSFATVVLGTPDPAQLASAVQMLGLQRQASRADVRAAYRRLAAEYHPDRRPGDASAAERFVAVGTAYRALTRYLEGQRTGGEREDVSVLHDLIPERARDTLLLEITSDDSLAGFGAEG